MTNIRIDKFEIQWILDESPDLSWLEQSDEEMGDGFEKRSKQRLESYGDEWVMMGCVARASVSYPLNGSDASYNHPDYRRLESLTSGGLWGIESDSSDEYRLEVESGQRAELIDHLQAFGVDTSSVE